MGDWVDELCNLFEQEIELYKKLLVIELEKRDAINRADGRSLQESAKSTYNLMVNASELERVRMKSIEDVYKAGGLEISQSGITLTDFLNRIDRESNFRLKGYATDLKTTVHKLKDAIIINEKLILTRQDLLKKTVHEMQKVSAEVTYAPNRHRKTSHSESGAKSLVLDASV